MSNERFVLNAPKLRTIVTEAETGLDKIFSSEVYEVRITHKKTF